MLFLSIFLFELLLLFLLSRLLTSSLSLLFLRLTRNQHITIRLLALLFLPGVVVHELSHALMAMLLLVPVGKIEFMPQLRGSHVKLGSVVVGRTDPLRRALIGFAPSIVGLVLIFFFLVLFLTQQFVNIPSWIRIAIVFYGIFQITNTMFSSRKDVEGTAEIIAVLAVLLLILYLVGFRMPIEFVQQILEREEIITLLQKVTFYLLIPLGIDIVVCLLVKMVLRVKE